MRPSSEADNHQDRYGRVGKHVHDRRAQIVVAMRRVGCVHMFMLVLMVARAS